MKSGASEGFFFPSITKKTYFYPTFKRFQYTFKRFQCPFKRFQYTFKRFQCPFNPSYISFKPSIRRCLLRLFSRYKTQFSGVKGEVLEEWHLHELFLFL